MIANTYVVKPFGISEVKVIALKGDPGSPTQEQVNAAVEEYMDDHPEAQIPDGAVSTAKIADDAVTTDKIDDDAVTTDKVEDEAITTEKMASNTVAPYADNLVSSSYVSDSEPYLIRKTFAGVREDDEIVGGSVVWNQLLDKGVYPATQTINGVTFTNNGDGTITVNGTATAQAEYALMSSFPLPYGHKVLMMGCPSGGSASTYALLDNYQSPVVRDVGNGIVYNINTTSNRATARIQVLSGVTVNNLVFKPQIFDLTLMFGPTVADYIYSLETATAGAGVAFFRSLFSKPYYAYNAGTLMSVNTSAHKMVGFNQFDDSILGTYGWTHEADGSWSCTSGAAYSSKVLWENTFGYTGQICFTMTYKYVPSTLGMKPRFVYTDGTYDTFYPTSSTTYNTVTYVSNANKTIAYIRTTYGIGDIVSYWKDVCINFSSSRNGQYEPYKTHSYPLDSSLTLRGLPKLDGDSIYYDGDIYNADGTVERRYGVVDLGTLTWSMGGASFASNTFSSQSIPTKAYGNVNFIANGYTATDSPYLEMQDKTIRGNATGNRVYIRDTAYADATAFKTAMSGVYLVYELAEPTTETTEPFTNPQVCYPNGTEEYIDTRDVPIPVGHNTKYMRDLKKLLEGIPDAPTANGTYVLKATVSASGVTYSWVEG